MPKPKKNEKKSDYIARCIVDEKMKKKFPEKEQRIAVCFSLWERERDSK